MLIEMQLLHFPPNVTLIAQLFKLLRFSVVELIRLPPEATSCLFPLILTKKNKYI